LGVASLALAMAALQRARRAKRKDAARGALFWMTTCGVMGAAALAANVVAVGRAVPAAEDPEIAEPALIARRLAGGDVAGACRVLEPALENSEAAAQAVGRRLPDLADKAKRCVEWELEKAKKLGAMGCESMVSQIGPMRFVRLSGEQQAVASACPSSEEPQK
jgi:hypothetical protein